MQEGPSVDIVLTLLDKRHLVIRFEVQQLFEASDQGLVSSLKA
jgi:hypothetical protein